MFSFHIYVNLLVLFLLLISSFIPLRSENLLGMISIFLNLLRLVLYHMIYPRECFVCASGECMYSAAVGWDVLYMSVRSI